MTQITFAVALSSFANNMTVKQNALDCAYRFPLASAAVHTSFYIDNGLVGANSLEGAINLQMQIQKLFACGGFLLCMWKASNPDALRHLSADLLDAPLPQTIHKPHEFVKVPGIKSSPRLDSFRQRISEFPRLEVITK